MTQAVNSWCLILWSSRWNKNKLLLLPVLLSTAVRKWRVLLASCSSLETSEGCRYIFHMQSQADVMSYAEKPQLCKLRHWPDICALMLQNNHRNLSVFWHFLTLKTLQIAPWNSQSPSPSELYCYYTVLSMKQGNIFSPTTFSHISRDGQ